MAKISIDPRMVEAMANGDQFGNGLKGCCLDKPFLWNAKRLEAASRLARQDAPKDVAKVIGAHWETVKRWLAHPTFKAKVQTLQEQFVARRLRTSVSTAEHRMRQYNRRHRALRKVHDELLAIMAKRAEAAKNTVGPLPPEAAGMETGLMVKKLKMLGAGDNAQLVAEYGVDTAWQKCLADVNTQLRELEKQAAIETGQWNSEATKGLLPGMNRRTMIVTLIEESSTDELKQLERSLAVEERDEGVVEEGTSAAGSGPELLD